MAAASQQQGETRWLFPKPLRVGRGESWSNNRLHPGGAKKKQSSSAPLLQSGKCILLRASWAKFSTAASEDLFGQWLWIKLQFDCLIFIIIIFFIICSQLWTSFFSYFAQCFLHSDCSVKKHSCIFARHQEKSGGVTILYEIKQKCASLKLQKKRKTDEKKGICRKLFCGSEPHSGFGKNPGQCNMPAPLLDVDLHFFSVYHQWMQTYIPRPHCDSHFWNPLKVAPGAIADARQYNTFNIKTFPATLVHLQCAA